MRYVLPSNSILSSLRTVLTSPILSPVALIQDAGGDAGADYAHHAAAGLIVSAHGAAIESHGLRRTSLNRERAVVAFDQEEWNVMANGVADAVRVNGQVDVIPRRQVQRADKGVHVGRTLR